MKPYLTRGWFRKGSKPTIKTVHTKKRRSVFGALSKDEFSAQLTEEKCNNITWLQFLKSLLGHHLNDEKPKPNTYLLIDSLIKK